jgi:hypothetical protein
MKKSIDKKVKKSYIIHQIKYVVCRERDLKGGDVLDFNNESTLRSHCEEPFICLRRIQDKLRDEAIFKMQRKLQEIPSSRLPSGLGMTPFWKRLNNKLLIFN